MRVERLLLTDHSLRRAGGRRIQFPGYAARSGSQPAAFDRQAHGMGHAQRVGGAGDARIEEHSVATQFHRDRHVAGGPDARVDDHGKRRIALLEVLENDPDVVGIEHTLPAADGAAGGHDAGGACLLEPPRHHRVVARVAEDLKTLLDQDLGRFQCGDRVGQEGPGVGENLELYPVGAGVFQPEEELTAQSRVRRASSAEKQPAVLGKIVYLRGSR